MSLYLLIEGDLGKEISSKFEKEEQFLVTVLTAMGEEQAVGVKAMTKWRKCSKYSPDRGLRNTFVFVGTSSNKRYSFHFCVHMIVENASCLFVSRVKLLRNHEVTNYYTIVMWLQYINSSLPVRIVGGTSLHHTTSKINTRTKKIWILSNLWIVS